MSHWRINIILLGFIFILSFFVYHSNEHEGSAKFKKNLSPLATTDVHSIRISKNDKTIILKKIENVWMMTQPIAIKANQFRIGSLLQLLTTNNYVKYASDTLDLKLYGLDQPTLRVTINNLEFDFGVANPINSKRYILFDDKMYLIDDVFYPLVNSQLGTLIDQSLLPDDITITRIQLPEITLQKNDAGLWRSNSQASADDIVKTLDHWKTAQAFSVHNYRPRPALDTINIFQPGRSQPIKFYVTDVEPWLIISRPDLEIEYHFDKEYIGKLLMTTLTISTPSNPYAEHSN